MMMRDSKDSLDSEEFLSGTGSDEPRGLLHIGAGGTTTSQRVLTTATAGYAVADAYALLEAVPPRFQAGAVVLAAPATVNATYRFVAAGDADEPQLVNADRTSILGRRLYEWSDMATGSTSGAKLAVAGDIRAAYTIVESLGVTLEIVPHLFGGSGRPTLQRGLVAFGRTGAGVVNPNAIRYLEVR
jgi:HK97 family phage major capsid protein